MNDFEIKKSEGEPNYILRFNDGLMTPKNESVLMDIVKILLTIFCVGLLLLIVLFGFGVLSEIPVTVWVCFVFALSVFGRQFGYERKPSPCELWFYDDFIIQYCERRYYSKNNIRKEYYKFYYKDINRCLYRTVVNKIGFYGKVEATFYKYNKDGSVREKPSKHIIAESISVFYTVFEPNIDFVKEIEEHSPIRIEFEES